jgi:hypothetical protein
MNDNGHPLANWRDRRARFVWRVCLFAIVAGACLIAWALDAAQKGCPR